MSHSEMVNTLAEKHGLSKKAVKALLGDFVSELKKVLDSDGTYNIPKFGTFYTIDLKPRKTPKGMSEGRTTLRFKQRRERDADDDVVV